MCFCTSPAMVRLVVFSFFEFASFKLKRKKRERMKTKLLVLCFNLSYKSSSKYRVMDDDFIQKNMVATPHD